MQKSCLALATAYLAFVQVAEAQTCLPNDRYATAMILDLKAMMSATNTRQIADRDTLYHIPVVPVSSIGLVTADSICARAGDALNTLYAESKARRLYVARLGGGWAVLDPGADPTARFIPVVIFDSTWVARGGYSGP